MGMVQCPICSQLLEILTTEHCKRVHGMSKEEVIKRYGTPVSVSVPFVASKKSYSHVVKPRDYTDYQLFDRRFRSGTRDFHSDR
jgi:hypothetical protein